MDMKARHHMDYPLIIFIVFVLACVAYGLLFPLKCPKCQTKLKLDRISDTWGLNITKKLILTPKTTGGFDSYYICPTCRKEFVQKKNRTKLEEVKGKQGT